MLKALKGAWNFRQTRRKKGECEMKKDELLKLDIQFFNDDEEQQEDNEQSKGDEPQNEQNSKPKDEEKKDEKLFTQEELEEIIKQRIARERKAAEKAIKEAEKLAKMNEEQKREYELEKARRENEELKAKLNRYELGQEATKILAKSGIVADDEILSFVVREDAEKTHEAIKAFTSLVDRISEEKMKEKLKGKPPTKNPQKTDGFKNPFSKDHFNLTEQGKLIKEDPELAKQLIVQAGGNPSQYGL